MFYCMQCLGESKDRIKKLFNKVELLTSNIISFFSSMNVNI